MVSALPEQTIAAGAHVSLDVRAGSLCIMKAIGMDVIFAEYAIEDQNVALDFFAYLEKNKDRFASVRIT